MSFSLRTFSLPCSLSLSLNISLTFLLFLSSFPSFYCLHFLNVPPSPPLSISLSGVFHSSTAPHAVRRRVSHLLFWGPAIPARGCHGQQDHLSVTQTGAPPPKPSRQWWVPNPLSSPPFPLLHLPRRAALPETF